MAWMGRLQSHPLIAEALAGEVISASWAREICSWTGRLPPELIKDADQIIVLREGARGSATLATSAKLGRSRSVVAESPQTLRINE